jgi:hypothetical protein
VTGTPASVEIKEASMSRDSIKSREANNRRDINKSRDATTYRGTKATGTPSALFSIIYLTGHQLASKFSTK